MEKNKPNTKIGKANIQQLIKEEASVIKRKKEIYEQIKDFNKEIGELNKKGLGKIGLNERTMAIGAHGFGPTPTQPVTSAPGQGIEPGQGIPAAKPNPTGFVYPQNISHVAELEAEFAPDETVVLDSPESKEVVDMPANKPVVDQDVKKQLIDMKEKLEMILSSIDGGVPAPAVAIVDAGKETEATQAAAQTEAPKEDDDDDNGEEEDEKEEKDEEEDEKEEKDEEEKDDEEEEIVIKESKIKTSSKSK